MKKLFAYLMLLMLSVYTTELHQLFKVPILFQHYAEHKELDSKVSFVAFLSMHYWGDDLNDHDDERDMQLPFKKLDAHSAHVFFIPVARIITLPYTQYLAVNYPVCKPGFHPDPTRSAPFRPPCA